MSEPEKDVLKPCPFCGGAGIILRNELREEYFVGCESCGGNAGSVEGWNRRATKERT